MKDKESFGVMKDPGKRGAACMLTENQSMRLPSEENCFLTLARGEKSLFFLSPLGHHGVFTCYLLPTTGTAPPQFKQWNKMMGRSHYGERRQRGIVGFVFT